MIKFFEDLPTKLEVARLITLPWGIAITGVLVITLAVYFYRTR